MTTPPPASVREACPTCGSRKRFVTHGPGPAGESDCHDPWHDQPASAATFTNLSNEEALKRGIIVNAASAPVRSAPPSDEKFLHEMMWEDKGDGFVKCDRDAFLKLRSLATRPAPTADTLPRSLFEVASEILPPQRHLTRDEAKEIEAIIFSHGTPTGREANRAPTQSGTPPSVTDAEMKRACATYCDIYEPSQDAVMHGRKVKHGKGNRGDAMRAVLEEFISRRMSTGLPHDAEEAKLVAFFRSEEGDSWGRKGDHANLSPAQTAIEAIRYGELESKRLNWLLSSVLAGAPISTANRAAIDADMEATAHRIRKEGW